MNIDNGSLDQLYIQVMKFRKKFCVYEITALMLDINPQQVVFHESKENEGSVKKLIVVDNLEEYFRAKEKEESVSIALHPKFQIFNQLKKAIIDSINSEELFALEHPQEGLDRLANHEERCAGSRTEVHKCDVEKWARENHFQCSFFGSAQQSTSKHDYLDKNHAEYSSELCIAIEAWQRFSGLGVSHPKKYVQKWLTEFYGQKDSDDSTQERVSKNGIERIVTLVNWRSKGGVGNSTVQQNIYQQALDKDLS